MLLVLLLYLKALTLDVLVRRSRFPKQDSEFEEEGLAFATSVIARSKVRPL